MGGNVEEYNLPKFKSYLKATIIKIMWYWDEDRRTNQWNQRESPEINPYVVGSL